MRSIFTAILLSLTALSLTHCAGKSVDDNDPAALYKEAEQDIQNDHYQIAIDKLRSIKNRFPYSKYSVDAQLKLADVYFLQESFGEAALAYETFRDLHPKHERVGYASFRIGKSYYKDSPGTVARDMTPAQKALDAYTDFLRRFPTAPEVEEARHDQNEIRQELAQKELYIGNFYFKEEQYDSAKSRYTKLIGLYPETASAKEAEAKLAVIAKKVSESKP